MTIIIITAKELKRMGLEGPEGTPDDKEYEIGLDMAHIASVSGPEHDKKECRDSACYLCAHAERVRRWSETEILKTGRVIIEASQNA